MVAYEFFYIIGALLLLAVIGYAVYRDMTRDKSKDAITEAATKEQYEHPERYQETQELFEKAAEKDRR